MANENFNPGHRPIDSYSAAASPNQNVDNDISEDWKKDVRICIAEDNRINKLVLCKLLNRLGYVQLSAYENGEEAVESLRQEVSAGDPYHIVFMDISMPVLDGFGATKLIREDPNEAIRGVPIIAMGAYAAQESVDQALAKGMDDYIHKPLHLQEIKAKLDTYLDPSQFCTDNHSEPSTITDEILLQLRPRL